MFGVIDGLENVSWKLFYGVDYHSHLGTAYGGIALQGYEEFKVIHDISQSQFKTEFVKYVGKIEAKMAIGCISAKDKQPIAIPGNGKVDAFRIIVYGYIENADQLAHELIDQGVDFPFPGKDKDGHSTVNTALLLGHMILQGENIPDGIKKMWDKIHGSASLLILNHDGIYAARTKYGHSSLTLGQKSNHAWAVTLESCAFPNLGFEPIKTLLPGEILLLTLGGPIVIETGSNKTNFCPFHPVYSSAPGTDFQIDGSSVSAEMYRERVGQYHALADIKKNILGQMVAGLPDSGTTYAIGYCAGTIDYCREETELLLKQLESGFLEIDDFAEKCRKKLKTLTPYHRPWTKYTPGWGRSYTPPQQMARDLVAKMKLIPVRDIIDEVKDIVVIDDSLVRGTQSREYLGQLRHIVESLWHQKMPRIHLRLGCPPLAWPCKFLFSTRTDEELAIHNIIFGLLARKPTKKELLQFIDTESREHQVLVRTLAKSIGVESIRYTPLKVMAEATGFSLDTLCTYCFNGVHI